MRKVSHNEVEKFAKQNNAAHFVVSAKNGVNINQMFADLSERVYKEHF